jgi:hypothetical protein
VGTFVTNPTRTDWFLIGTGGFFNVPAGGGTLFVAVNDSFSGDNNGAYSLNFTAVPEPSVALSLAVGGVTVGALRFRRRRTRSGKSSGNPSA